MLILPTPRACHGCRNLAGAVRPIVFCGEKMVCGAHPTSAGTEPRAMNLKLETRNFSEQLLMGLWPTRQKLDSRGRLSYIFLIGERSFSAKNQNLKLETFRNSRLGMGVTGLDGVFSQKTENGKRKTENRKPPPGPYPLYPTGMTSKGS